MTIYNSFIDYIYSEDNILMKCNKTVDDVIDRLFYTNINTKNNNLSENNINKVSEEEITNEQVTTEHESKEVSDEQVTNEQESKEITNEESNISEIVD